jgi:hypothetical protein
MLDTLSLAEGGSASAAFANVGVKRFSGSSSRSRRIACSFPEELFPPAWTVTTLDRGRMTALIEVRRVVLPRQIWRRVRIPIRCVEVRILLAEVIGRSHLIQRDWNSPSFR